MESKFSLSLLTFPAAASLLPLQYTPDVTAGPVDKKKKKKK